MRSGAVVGLWWGLGKTEIGEGEGEKVGARPMGRRGSRGSWAAVCLAVHAAAHHFTPRATQPRTSLMPPGKTESTTV